MDALTHKPPSIEEMRRVAHYLSDTMKLHSAAGKLLARADKLESIVERLMDLPPKEVRP